MMKISVIGLGYVGAVSAACLASEGHEIVGVDISEARVALINQGVSPIVEAGLPELISETVSSGHLRATTDILGAVRDTDISIVCVGTPSQINGNLDLSHIRRVCGEIGIALRDKVKAHLVVFRSTMLPGSLRSVAIPTLEEASGKRAGYDFTVCNNPEFLREGTAIKDYYHAAKTVIGECRADAGKPLMELYKNISAPLIVTDIETAEMVKYADNCWHAVKVSFANEIGNLAKAVGIDGHKVMDIFCQDTKLNLSSYYMKPGFAFGGSCLPKDVRALTYKGRSLDLDLPLLNAILPSNAKQVQKGLSMVLGTGKRKIGLLGLAFKAGTDDLRESPLVELLESLIGKGYDLCVYDSNVQMARLVGGNRDYILNHIPHISRLMVGTLDEILDFAEVLVIGNGSEEFRTVPGRVRAGQIVIDLVRISPEQSQAGRYDGICW
jgi:GDP-mannose 6-dehydrogenase